MKNLFVIIILYLMAFSFSIGSLETKEEEKSGETMAIKDVSNKVITNSIGMKLRLIEPGEFMMGSEKGDKQEKPVHKVKITQAFYIGVYEVTQEQCEKIMGKNPSSFKGANLPVDSVGWKDAEEFCKKLSEKEGVEYFLPTEAQWEYACRAGSNTEYYWGDKMDNEFCWFTGTSARKTHDVGTKKPNDFGLYDMSGNVYEICSDWYDENYYTVSPEEDPKGPEKGAAKAIRGGSWNNRETYCRSASRVDLSDRAEMQRIGFRVCCVVSENEVDVDANNLVINITKGNEIIIEGNRISSKDDYKELRLKLRNAISNEDNIRLIIRADRETPFGKVVEIWNIAVLEGIDNIAFAVEHAEEKNND